MRKDFKTAVLLVVIIAAGVFFSIRFDRGEKTNLAGSDLPEEPVPMGYVTMGDIDSAGTPGYGEAEVGGRVWQIPDWGKLHRSGEKAAEKTKTLQRELIKPQEKPARTHTVGQGETLSGISEEYYGTSSQWRKIYEANGDVIKHPDSLETGSVLVIP